MKAWKVQKFFGDLIYDMRSRGLLPFAALLVVAMFAVPFYFASQASDQGPPVVPSAQSAAELAPENQAAVVAYEPGVRNYKQRLSDQQEKDPFIQQFQVTPEATDALESSSAAESVAGSGGSGGGGGGGIEEIDEGNEEVVVGNGGKPETLYYSYETDVAVGELGTPLVSRKRIGYFDYLPSQDAPVLSYMGTLNGGKQAVFLVSEDVVDQTGGGSCFPTPEACQLLALGPKEIQDLTYGPANKVFRIEVERIKLTVTKKPPAN